MLLCAAADGILRVALRPHFRLDPSLTSSAHIGFALPVIKIGWGVSVSLTVSTSSLLRYAKFVAGEDVSAEPKQLQQNSGDNHSMEQNELIADSVADTMG